MGSGLTIIVQERYRGYNR